MIKIKPIKIAVLTLLLCVSITVPVLCLSLDSIPEMPTADFEDGTTHEFVRRGNKEILTVTDETAYSGTKSLKVSNRTQGWHGPSKRIENYIEEGMEYVVTVRVKAITPDSSNFRLSTQIGDGADASYTNICVRPVSKDEGWVELTGKHRYSNTASGFITVYIENDTADAEYYIDDVDVIIIPDSKLNADLTLPSLKDIYKDYFLLGTAFVAEDLQGMRFDLIKHHFNVATAGNDMKPVALAPTKDNFSFDAIDDMISTVESGGLLLHGHTLAWHEQSAPWLNTDGQGNALPRAEAEENLKVYVRDVGKHFAGKVISWDVLNEAINDNPPNPSDWKGALRHSDWYKAFDGADYIDMLFREARKADPNAILYYNDYGLDNQNKATAVASMVKELNDAYIAEGNSRLLIEGIGMQAHYNMNTSVYSVEESIKRFIELGVEISITELDITVSSIEDEIQQGIKYAWLLSLFKKYSDHIARVTFWGIDDATSWRSSQYPLLFNSNLSAKEAFYAVADPYAYLVKHTGLVVAEAPITVTSESIETEAAIEAEPPIETETPIETEAPSSPYEGHVSEEQNKSRQTLIIIIGGAAGLLLGIVWRRKRRA